MTLSDWPNLNGTAFAANEVWNGNPLISSTAVAVGAFAWAANSNDSALLVTMPPGIYTAQIAGGTGDTGEAMFEIYLVP